MAITCDGIMARAQSARTLLALSFCDVRFNGGYYGTSQGYVPAGTPCKEAAKLAFPTDRKTRHAFKRECKQAWKAQGRLASSADRDCKEGRGNRRGSLSPFTHSSSALRYNWICVSITLVCSSGLLGRSLHADPLYLGLGFLYLSPTSWRPRAASLGRSFSVRAASSVARRPHHSEPSLASACASCSEICAIAACCCCVCIPNCCCICLRI